MEVEAIKELATLVYDDPIRGEEVASAVLADRQVAKLTKGMI